MSSLRFHPALIVPAEVRDGAAYQAAIAGQTGHTVLTSFHADGAQDAYKRLVALCNTAGTGLADARLLDMCIGAWPIVIFQKQLKDNTRKIMEVFEATGQKTGRCAALCFTAFILTTLSVTGPGISRKFAVAINAVAAYPLSSIAASEKTAHPRCF